MNTFLINDRNKITRIEVAVIDPSDMETSVAIRWFGINSYEWGQVRQAIQAGTWVYYYVWEAFTADRVRLGSMVYTRTAKSSGGMLRCLHPTRLILRQDRTIDDAEALEIIAEWVFTVSRKRPRIQVVDGSRSDTEHSLARDFTAYLEHKRSKRIGQPLITLPVPTPKEGKNVRIDPS